MNETNEPGLPDGVSRWVFIVPGAVIGFLAGLLLGWLPAYAVAAAIVDSLSSTWPTSPRWLLPACWLWCVFAATAVGGYLGYDVWRTDDSPKAGP